MPRMNPQTMNWSLRLSRWKHMVVTSLSAAPLQIGSDCDRQKLRLHWLHDGDEELPCARRASRVPSLPSPSAAASKSARPRASWSSAELSSLSSGSVVPSDGGWCCEGGLDGELPVEDLGFISMIVLLVKQVHLQNVGAAIYVNARSVRQVHPGGESQLLWCIDRWMFGLTYTLRPPGRRKRLGGV